MELSKCRKASLEVSKSGFHFQAVIRIALENRRVVNSKTHCRFLDCDFHFSSEIRLFFSIFTFHFELHKIDREATIAERVIMSI